MIRISSIYFFLKKKQDLSDKSLPFLLIIFYLSTIYLAKWNKLKVHIFFFRYACMKTVHAYTHACAPTHTCTHAHTQTHTHRIRIAFHCACISNWKKKKHICIFEHFWQPMLFIFIVNFCQILFRNAWDQQTVSQTQVTPWLFA